SIRAEVLNGFSRARIDGVKPTTRRVHNSSLFAALPERDATINARTRVRTGIKAPKFATGGGINGEQLQRGRGPIKNAVDNQRIALNLGTVIPSAIAGVIFPRDFEAIHIVSGDLLQLGKMRAFFITEI